MFEEMFETEVIGYVDVILAPYNLHAYKNVSLLGVGVAF
jgi:hypothetical protein